MSERERRTSDVTVGGGAVEAEEQVQHASISPPGPDLSAIPVAPDDGFLTTGGERDPLASATLAADEAAAARLEAMASGDPEAVAAAVRAESDAVLGALAAMTPEQRAEFLADAGGEGIRAVLDTAIASGDEALLSDVVASLVQSGESLDEGALSAIADRVGAAGIRHLLPALTQAMVGGHGTRLGVQLAEGNHGLGYDDIYVQNAVHAVMWESERRMERATSAANELRAELAAGVARLQQLGFSEEHIAAWEAETREQHAGVLEEYDTATRLYGGTLAGRAHGQAMAGGPVDQYSLQGVETFLTSPAAGQAVAESLMLSANGETTWLDSLDPETRERAVLRGAMEGVAAFVSTGDVESIDVLLHGVAEASPEQAEAVAALRERLSGLDPSLEGDARSEAIAAIFSEYAASEPGGLAERLMRSSALGFAASIAGAGSDAPTAYGRVGNAFARFGYGISAIQHLADGDSEIASRVAHAGVDLGLLISTAPRFATNFPVATVAFSLIDAGIYAAEGNLEAAGLALAPAIGASVGFLLGGPVGAFFGGLAGSVLGAVLSAFGVGSVDEIARLVEPAVREGLVQAGFSPELAERLAPMLSSEEYGAKLQAVADAYGLTTTELLERLASGPPGYAQQMLEYTDLVLLQTQDDGTRVAIPELVEEVHFMFSGEGLEPGETEEDWQQRSWRRTDEWRALQWQRDEEARRRFHERMAGGG